MPTLLCIIPRHSKHLDILPLSDPSQPSHLTSPSHLPHLCLRTALPIVLSSFPGTLCIIFPSLALSHLSIRSHLSCPPWPIRGIYSAIVSIPCINTSSILPSHLIHPALIHSIHFIHSILYYTIPPIYPPQYGSPWYTCRSFAAFLWQVSPGNGPPATLSVRFRSRCDIDVYTCRSSAAFLCQVSRRSSPPATLSGHFCSRCDIVGYTCRNLPRFRGRCRSWAFHLPQFCCVSAPGVPASAMVAHGVGCCAGYLLSGVMNAGSGKCIPAIVSPFFIA